MSANGPLDRLLGAIVQPVVGAVDVDSVVGQVDVDHLVSQVDVDALVKRVDVNDIVERVDVNGIVERMDVNELMRRVDVDALLDRVDANALIERIDVDALMQRVDLDALLARVDVSALVQRANIDAIVRDASQGMFARGIDLVRRQLVGLDLVVNGVVNRLFRRTPEGAAIDDAGTVTGLTGGGISRLAAYLIDTVVLSLSFALLTALGSYLFELLFGRTPEPSHRGGLFIGALGLFSFLYFWIGLVITGRSIGKAVVGLRVVALDDTPITPGRAAVRQLVYPLSFILGLGLLPIVIGRRRRALHDWAARDEVVYDWGDRPAELPAPLTAYLRRARAVPDAVVAPVGPPATTETGTTTTGTGHPGPR